MALTSFATGQTGEKEERKEVLPGYLELPVVGQRYVHVHVVGEVSRVCPLVAVAGIVAHRRRAIAAGFRLLPHRNALKPDDARRKELTNTWRNGGSGGRGASIIDQRDASEWQEALNDRRSVL